MGFQADDLHGLHRVPQNEAPNSVMLAEGARNLLINCAGMNPGDSLLVVAEDPELGWYDAAAPEAVRRTATELGFAAKLISVGAPTFDGKLPEVVAEAMAAADQTVFFSRMGDQARFQEQLPSRPPVMSYATDAATLASPYGRVDYEAFLELKAALNETYDRAGKIRVTCPLGTDISGQLVVNPDDPEDVSIKRFPMGIYKPVPCHGFKGRVALSRFLVSTGSRAYEPSSTAFEGLVFAETDGTRIVRFDGPLASVDAIEKHYETVAGLFGIDPMFVHSWHSGMHPGCMSPYSPSADPNRWANMIFQNPRVLHFHTCGAFPPGEISWTVVDPTIEVDDRPLWRAGILYPDTGRRIGAVLRNTAAMSQLFQQHLA